MLKTSRVDENIVGKCLQSIAINTQRKEQRNFIKCIFINMFNLIIWQTYRAQLIHSLKVLPRESCQLAVLYIKNSQGRKYIANARRDEVNFEFFVVIVTSHVKKFHIADWFTIFMSAICRCENDIVCFDDNLSFTVIMFAKRKLAWVKKFQFRASHTSLNLSHSQMHMEEKVDWVHWLFPIPSQRRGRHWCRLHIL